MKLLDWGHELWWKETVIKGTDSPELGNQDLGEDNYFSDWMSDTFTTTSHDTFIFNIQSSHLDTEREVESWQTSSNGLTGALHIDVWISHHDCEQQDILIAPHILTV